MKVGFIGFGTVASGAIEILNAQRALIERRLGTPIEIAGVADLDIERDRGVQIAKEMLTTDAARIIKDPSIDIVVELIGGLTEAKGYILDAVRQGKHIVTANKALLAVHGEEIFGAASENGVDVGFEAAVCGGIPIIRALKEGLAAEDIHSIYGIVNGTCNYILSQMLAEKRDFSDLLKEAQQLGYAEADPSLDVGGGDSAHKIAILTNLAFGTPVALSEIYTEGVEKITPIDIAFADTFGYQVKLLAITKRVEADIEVRVHPTMISKETLLSNVNGVFNAVYIDSPALGATLYYGQGAGSLPTGSAVVSDIVDIARNIQKRSSLRVPVASFMPSSRKRLRVRPIEEIKSLYYLRFMVQDRPGVLSKISGILGAHHISISSVIQQGRKIGGDVPLVMMTHLAKERDLQSALSKIDGLDCISGATLLIRVEGEDRA
ncbi:MAG: homoserine dehydrogenase [Nitrospiria bacterium]